MMSVEQLAQVGDLATASLEIPPAVLVTDRDGDVVVEFTCKRCGQSDRRVRARRGPLPSVCDRCLEASKHPGTGTEHGDHPTLDGRDHILAGATLPIGPDEDPQIGVFLYGRRFQRRRE